MICALRVNGLLDVMWLLVFYVSLPRGVVDRSAVCESGISGSFLLTFYRQEWNLGGTLYECVVKRIQFLVKSGRNGSLQYMYTCSWVRFQLRQKYIRNN